MNTEEAKLILAAVHDDTPANAETEAALALLESDSALQQWFQEERAFDNAISQKLSEIKPPADLKTSLIKLMGENTDTGESTTPPANVTWFKPPFLAAAAAIILIPIVAIQLFTTKATAKNFDNFRQDMVEFASGDFKLDHRDNELDNLYTWLNDNNATCPIELPECIGCPQSVGCKIIDWNKESVTLICLRNGENQVVHCFVIPRDEFKELPEEALLRSKVTNDNLETTSWSDAKNVYLLVGSEQGVKVTPPKM